MSQNITITTLQTNIPVLHSELEAVKKALGTWLKKRGFARHTWIHNHEDESDPGYLRQPYPLIQFRCPEGKLMLWGMQDGASILQEIMLTEMLRGFQYKSTQCYIVPELTSVKEYKIGFTRGRKKNLYELNYFVGLSPVNFKAWQQLPDAARKTERLQELLVNNMAMACKAAGWVLEKEKLQLHIDWIWHTRWVFIKEHKVLAFTLSYYCNLELPDGMALGRQAKLGYGWQTLR